MSTTNPTSYTYRISGGCNHMHGANADIGVTSEHSIRSTHRYENITGTKQKPTETTRSTLPTRSPQQSPTSPVYRYRDKLLHNRRTAANCQPTSHLKHTHIGIHTSNIIDVNKHTRRTHQNDSHTHRYESCNATRGANVMPT